MCKLVKEYDLAEGFVFDYKNKFWRKCKQKNGEITENPSFCNTIDYDLNDFVK